ncbi:MAG: 50S ribosome-binding GTPase, partial [Planctomycetales bacterium]|nr:50S ribosome-binding GTPase [Planctomycetales bacterium]
MNTIVARLTPAVPAAIATLAISGPLALSCVERFVRLSGAGLAVGSLRFGVWEVAAVGQGHVKNPTAERRATLNIAGEPTAERRATLEQVVLTRPEADTVEVHCHGGAAVCQALLSDLVSAGCVLIAAEQWPSRLSCPLARAAEEDLLNATTDRAAAVLLDQFSGALRKAVENVARRSASDELDDSASASAGLEQLLRWADFGLHLSQPWRIVLAGPPNVGKSSLLNALAGTRQAIVHHQPGTTRDWIEWSSAIDGWPVVFTDTAGIRAASEPIEQAGVERSLKRLIEA